jgi:hypothetical protein
VSLLDLLVEFLGFAFILLFVVLLLIFNVLSRRQAGRRYREIPAFTKLRRAVGLSVEAGTRLHISLGRSDLTGPQGAVGLAGLSVLDRAARAAALSDRPPISTTGEGTLTALSQESLKAVLQNVSPDRSFDPTTSRLTGLTPFSYAAGAMPVIHDEHVSTNILLGHLGSEVALLTEAGDRTGSLTIAGTDDVSAQAVLYAAAQEPLIGEEVYASGAYLGAGPAHTSSLRVQDLFRWALVVVILLGALARLVGVL